MSESRTQRGPREKHGGGHRERQQQQQQQQRHHRPHQNTRPSSNSRSSARSQYTSRNQSSHSQHGRRPTSGDVHGSKCAHICSRRGIVLMCAFLCNLLVLFCVVAAYVTLSGMSAMSFASGGSFVDAIIPFEGTELQQVRDLDMQFSQMRAPGIYGGLAFSITFGVLSLLFVMSGNKPAHVLSRKILIGQFAFQAIGAVAYVIAVGLYLYFVIKVNSTDVCLLRERLYARNGQTWMNCSVNGADAAVALFGIIVTILYAIGAVLTGRTIYHVNRYVNAHNKAQKPNRPDNSQDTPLESGIYI
ncbi:MARVEL domain-containing protein 3 [Silurus meridionalis]|uniref:MARVEL domain-containing protein n=1 Tax=Silurus meridionalis TaxID=175797 RepID=A0A8T0AFW6_SILME|nr:MARVEL domain-containing protein 3 [Silurus meridionalis]KAF7690198.1 hypothetical protein HF521_012002 [Silurus meridionalis]